MSASPSAPPTPLVTVASIGPAALSTPDAAAYLGGLSKRTLERWRHEGTGPAYVYAGGKAVYLVADLDAWLAANRVSGDSK